MSLIDYGREYDGALIPVIPEATQEERTIAAVGRAISAIFPHANPSSREAVDTCAGLIAFLRAAEAMPPRSLTEWREAIENLNVGIGA